jgi:hypothetical protein
MSARITDENNNEIRKAEIKRLEERIAEVEANITKQETIRDISSIVDKSDTRKSKAIAEITRQRTILAALTNLLDPLKNEQDKIDKINETKSKKQNETTNKINEIKELLRSAENLEDLWRYNNTEILEVLIDNEEFKLSKIMQFGYTQNDILDVLISRKTPLEEIFNSRFQFTHGYLKQNIDKFDLTIKASFKDFSKNIEGPAKCVKDGFLGKFGNIDSCYYDSTSKKYMRKKGGGKKRSYRKQYRRSRKISKKNN